MGKQNESANGFLSQAIHTLTQAAADNAEAIETGAQMLFDARQKGGRFFVFGTGHSHILAEELYTRAGGYAEVYAILPPEMMLHEIPNKSTLLERLPGYAHQLIALYGIKPGDVVLIASNSGRNPAPVEMAMECKEMGCQIIAVTSLAHSGAVAPRPGIGKRLFEVADLVLDNHSVLGDACYTIPGTQATMGPTSTIVGAALVHALTIAFMEKLAQAGIEPPVYRSGNLDGSDEYNRKLMDACPRA